MLTKLAAFFTKVFNIKDTATYGSELEQYVVSKGPQSVAEIEHWTKQFDHARNTKGWL